MVPARAVGASQERNPELRQRLSSSDPGGAFPLSYWTVPNLLFAPERDTLSAFQGCVPLGKIRQDKGSHCLPLQDVQNVRHSWRIAFQ